ncbi:hypothetical protein OPQ81_001715 [Rhizoctonia solani]|nr:hypothetical protein OPQ81_001715 [Rhizoctonia solani]
MFDEGVDAPKPLIQMELPDRPTADRKHVGYGSIEFAEEKTVDMFMAKLKTEPIMFAPKNPLTLPHEPHQPPRRSGGPDPSLHQPGQQAV